MAVRMNQQETGGFKLLQEDALDDRPCPAVKKFVTSVLDRKDMKDQEVANSFRNLMEYRDSASSPSACSVATSSSVLDGDRLNSPPSPSSPTTAPGPMDDQRLPNELLDEICEDIGMKEGMELDFVEYLMEQDTNPQLYMTQEAISSAAFNGAARSSISTPTGSASGSSNSGSASGSHISSTATNNNNNNENKTLTVLNPPVTTTTPNFLFKQNFGDSDWLHQIPMAGTHSTSSGPSSGSTTVQSSENNSPANKRVHLSVSTDNSPNKGRSQTPPGFNQYNNACGRPGTNSHNLFKMPQPGPLMAKRSHSYPQGAPTSSPVQSTNSSSSSSSQGSNASSQASNHAGFSRSQEFATNMSSSSCQPSDCSDQEDLTSSSANNKSKSTSPKPALPSAPTCDFSKPGSPSQARSQGQFGGGLVGGRDGSMFQRVSKQAPTPAVGGKPMQAHVHQHPHHSLTQHQRWMGPALPQLNHNSQTPFFTKAMYPGGPFQSQQHQHVHHHPAMGHGHMGHMPGPTDPHLSSVPTPVDSPLDQGYFSNESAGNCSNGSAPSPAFTSSSMSSFSSISTIMPADHSQKNTLIHHQQQQQQQQQQQTASSGISNSRPSGQKSVHFADLPNGSPPAYTGPSTPSDCAFEMESNGQPKMLPSGKMMPRFNHSMKSGVAPYTVPNNQGQVIGPPLPSGYDINNRPSCAMSMSADGSSPGEPMQEYMPKGGHINGSSNSAFYMDGNQNMLRMDSMHDYPSVPPPLISPQPSDYVSLQADQPHYGMNQFSSMHQQQPSAHSQQSSHPSSSADSMPPLQTHPHLQSAQQQHHHHHHHDQSHPFSSCSYSTQCMPSDLGPPHQNSMQISHDSSSGGYHVPLAVSTPMSSRPGPNSRLAPAYPGQMCSPVYEGSYEQSGRPDLYPPQQPHGVMPSSQGVMSSQQASSIHRGWAAEDLRVQVGGMQPNLSPMKGGLQPAHSQGLPHMQPSPTPACAAPLGPGSHIQDMSMVSSSVHVNSNMGPPHPHMGPHPEYGPCMGITCNLCKMNQAGSQPHPHPHMGPCPSPNCHMCKMSHPCVVPQPATAMSHVGPCAGPGCTACKVNQSSRPQMLSSQQKFIQHLIMDEANSAYRSHPLFPLLRDLVIAEMNFDNPRFHYQQLLSLLPHDFHKLLQNFLHRNPPSGHYQSNQAVESVIMDSLRLAHSNLVDKITHRQEMEKMKANSSASLRSMEEFCQKFDHSVTGPMGRPGPNGTMGLTHPMAGYHEGGYIQHGMGHVYRSMKDGPDVYGEAAMGVASPQTNKTESKKHPSLPKEAVAMMMEWLRNHKDNPYPNDDEKAMLIKQTGLSINQINYWFTNARRRILPKWAQCKT
ncbi:hypothetical protein BsWGS_25800 [Bradybaena similaris]